MKSRVVLLRDLPEERRASMERYADDLFRELEDERHSISVRFAPTPSPNQFHLYPFDKIINYSNRYIRYPSLTRNVEADVYHVIDHSYAHLIRSLDPSRVVVTCHDLMLLTQSEWAGKLDRRPALYMFRYSTSFLPRARWIIAVSQTTSDDLVRLGLARPDQVVIIPPGLSAQFRARRPESRLSFRERFGIADDDLVILSVGSTNPYKNLGGVVNTALRAAELHRNVVLLRAGRPLPPALTARLESSDQIRYIETGAVSDQDLVSAYNASSVLLFPSFKEGFGWPVIEAMQFGCPVVTSTERTISSNVGDAALRFDPYDSDAMAKSIVELHESSVLRDELKGMGFAAAARFTWERSAREIAALYESMLGPR